MSAAATKKKDVKEPDIAVNVEDLLRQILLAAVAVPERGVPVFVGPTQYGKTKFIRDFYIHQLGIKPENVVWMNPQNDLPEDIGGWPKREGDWLEFTQPANIPPRLIEPKNYDAEGNPKVPWGIITDEIDKAREETLSAMLTFFNPDERRLRSTRIPRRVPIIGAMNEPENRIIPEPLLARLLFLPFPCPGMQIADRTDLRAIRHIAEDLFGSLPEIKFPARPKAPGSMHKLASWIQADVFWSSEIARNMIVRGLFNDRDSAVVLSRLREQLPEPSEAWAKSVRPSEMINHIVQVLDAGNYDACVKVLFALVERSSKENDPTGEFERLLTIFLETPEALHAVHRPELQAEGIKALRKKLGDLDDAKAKQAAKKDKD